MRRRGRQLVRAALVVLVLRRSTAPGSVKILLAGVCVTLLVRVPVTRPVLDERTLKVMAERWTGRVATSQEVFCSTGRERSAKAESVAQWGP